MRVALCLSGMVRTLNATYPGLKRFLIEPFHADVFVQTYDRMGARTENDLPVSANWLNGLLRPKEFEMLSYTVMAEEHKRRRDSLYRYPGPIRPFGQAPESRWKLANVLSQVFLVYQCDQMRRKHEEANGFQYDLVIRARMDNLFSQTPNPLDKHGLECYPNDTIFIPDHSNYGGICDQFAMGAGGPMAVYSDYHLHFEAAYRSRPLFPAYCGGPETLLNRYLTKLTRVQAVKFTFPFELQRLNEVEQQSHKTDQFYEEYIAKGLAT